MTNFDWKHDINGMLMLHYNGVIVAKQIPSKHQLTIICTSIDKRWDFIVFDGSLSDFTKNEIETFISFHSSPV